MAKKQINGITIAIDADTKGVTSGLKDLTEQSVTLSKQLKSVTALLDMDGGNTELMATKQALLAKQVETTKQKLEALKAAQDDVRASVEKGDIGTDEYLAFQRELIMTEKRLRELEGQSDDTGEEVKELGEETKQTGTEMEKTEKQSGRLGESLKNGLAAGAKAAAAGIAAMTAAAAATAAAIINAAGAAAEYGDNIDKMSQKLGMSTDAYQEWDFIMQHSGSDIDKMSTSMKKLADAVQEPTKESTAAFEKLGISIEKASKMSQEDLFATTIEALQKLESGTERTALANDLLGKSAMDLGALLNMSAEETEAMRKEVHDLGGVMSKDAVATAAAYQDSLQNMKTAIGGVTREIGGSFMPSMIQMMNSIAQIASGNMDAIEGLELGLDRFLQNLEETVDDLSSTAEQFLPIIVDAISRALPKLAESGLKIMKALGSAIITNLPQITSAGGKILLDLAASLLKEMPRIIKVGVEVITTLARGIADALPSLVPQIVDVVLEIVDILTDPKTLGTLIDAAFEIITALVEGLLSEASINKMIDMVPEVVDNVVDILIDSVDKLLDAAIQIIKALCDYFMDPENREKIKEAAGKILDKLGEGCRELVGNLLPFIKDVATAWAEMFIGEIDYDATASDVLARLGKAFVHNFFHSPQKLGEWIYDLAHLGGGDSENSGSGGHFATGGLFTAPTRAMIGENGAEVVLPLENNTGWMDILAAKISGAGGAGVTIGEINVTVSDPNSTGIGQQIVQQIDESLRDYQIAQARGIGGTAWDT